MFLVCLRIVACSGDNGGGGARTPNAEDFSSPTGSLTNENANEVAQVLFNVFRHEAGGYPGGNDLNDLNDIATSSCNTVISDGTTGSLDFKCWFSAFMAKSGCTGSGTLTYTSPSASETTFEDQNISIHCPAGVFTSDAYEKMVNGEVKVNFSMPPPASFGNATLCANVSETINGTVRASDYCEDVGSAMVSVNQSDGNILCTYTTNSNVDCTSVSLSCKDAMGDATITCDAAPSSGISNCVNPLQTASNCKVTR